MRTIGPVTPTLHTGQNLHAAHSSSLMMSLMTELVRNFRCSQEISKTASPDAYQSNASTRSELR